MTTIAYRAGVMAADTRAYSGDKVPIGFKTKIHRLSDGSLFGCSSSSVGADGLLRRWVDGGCQPCKSDDLKPDGFQLLLIRPSGDVFYAKDNMELTGPLSAAYFAIGSGDQFALGAMAVGASAKKAIEAAATLDPWTGGEITVIRQGA